IAAINAKTDEERAARIDEFGKVYEGLSEAEKERAEPFINRLNDTHSDLRLRIGDREAAAATDATLEAVGPTADRSATFDKAAERARGLAAADAAAEADALFGPAPDAKPPTKAAAAAPRVPGPSVG